MEMLILKVALLTAGIIFLILFNFPPARWFTCLEKELFEKYIKKFNKSYENTTIYNLRYEAFKANLLAIETFNNARTDNMSATYGLTHYSDLFAEEFASLMLQQDYQVPIKAGRGAGGELTKRDAIGMLPRKIDWRLKGVITDVNNQYSCGACWAFSTIETIESMHAIKSGQLTRLSTQQMIDCAGYNNKGCLGGDICTLLEWLTDQDVIIRPQVEYPLRLQTQTCKNLNSSHGGVKVLDFECLQLIGNENYLLYLLAGKGPVAVAINAIKWQNYLGGVIQYHCSSHFLLMNHAVQIVGYDLEAEIPHYIVRNSWGTDFGDKGYLYIAIGDNLCGIANEVSAINVS